MPAREPATKQYGGGLTRIRLDIAYDGTNFSGWARQPQRRTVQGVLEETISTVLRQDIRLTVAGRTDAGVHATGQVAHFDTAATLPEGLVRRLARMLPPDVRVLDVRAVPLEFDARFSALRRHYRYRLSTADSGVNPLRAHEIVPWPHGVDLDRINEASQDLLGEHDFVAFCRHRVGATTVRALERFSWCREDDGVIVAEVSADAFCHSMVRSLVGALLTVGDGRRPVEWPAELLKASSRVSSVPVVPARGLVLVAVDYPSEEEFAARAARTRNVRTLG